MAAVVNITRSAIRQLHRVALDHDVSRILFSVKSGGCVGFQYQLDPMQKDPHKNDVIVPLEDTSSELVICGQSLMHVFGTTIDWKKDIMGETFHFDNPAANQSCGCGTSFN